jgi:hypothetical protein
VKGAPITYSEAELAFISARRHLPRAEICAAFVLAFGRTDVRVEHITGLCKRKRWGTARATYSAADDAVLIERFADTPTAELAAMLKRPAGSVTHRARRLGLTKSAAYLATPASGRMQPGTTIGARTQFPKGGQPANKGRTYPKGWSPGRMASTQFRAGQDVWNHKPIGFERVAGQYTFTKVSDLKNVPWTVNWKLTHVLKWEALHGPVPDGQCLKSRDGDRLNTDPENWQLVAKAIMPRLNGGRSKRLGYDVAPAELRPILLKVAQIAHAMKHARKRQTQGRGA